ncbi:MAG: hypothetical protein K1Y01_08660 [Vicinamibacteria bacterium]|nr:hypothetical protein [Vicinamibacteria bacterium]
MPLTKTDLPLPKPDVSERSAFEEPSISAPLELANGQRGPMMAMVGGSSGGPGFDGPPNAFFPPRGDGNFGDVGADGGFGPGPDGSPLDV